MSPKTQSENENLTNQTYDVVESERMSNISSMNIESQIDDDSNGNVDIEKLGTARYIFFLFATVSIFMSSGLFYGWPSLRYKLKSSLSNKQLDYMFTVGSLSSYGLRSVFGLIRDRKGTRVTTCCALTCTVIGCIGFAIFSSDNLHGLSASIFFLGCGSSVQLCLQPIAAFFPSRYHGFILSVLSGSFQMSGLVTSLLVAGNERSLTYGIYSVFLVCLIAIALRILPDKNIQFDNDTLEYQSCVVPSIVTSNGLSQNKHTIELNNTLTKNNFQDEYFDDSGHTNSNDTCATGGKDGGTSNNVNVGDSTTVIKYAHNDLKNIMRSMDYMLLILWFSVQVIPSQYYIGTIGYQLEKRGIDEDGHFSYMFPYVMALAALTSPIIGIIADNYGIVQTHLCSTIFPSISLFILSSSSNSWHVLGIFVFAVGRIMVFSTFFIHIGKVYQYTHYGTLVGTGFMISAIFSLLQYPLLSKASAGYETLVNSTLAFALLFQGLPYCFWLHEKGKN